MISPKYPVTFFVIFPLSLIVSGVQADFNGNECPITCHCIEHENNVLEKKVSCDYKKFWTKIPKLPRNTTYFSLRNSNIKVLREGSFSKSGDTLKTLYLMYNHISELERGVFRHLKVLRTLKLTGNKLRTLRNETLSELPMITDLYLSSNRFSFIPTDNICGIESLRMFSMYGNYLKSARFDDCFTRLNKLKTINLSKNKIRKIQSDDFWNLRNCSITSMSLAKLKLSALPPDVFKYTPHLKVLQLQDNELTSLPTTVFEYTRNLTQLMLRGNKLTTGLYQSLSPLIKLRSLEIDINGITNGIIGYELKKMKDFMHLSLDNNPLVNLTNNSFISLYNASDFTQLSLIECKLRMIESDTFLPLKSLYVLRLDQNALDAAKLQHIFYGLRYASNLTSLYLNNAYLKGMSNITFQHLTNTSIAFLWLEGCAITVVRERCFVFLSKLQNLRLGGNLINQFELNAFQGLQYLEALDLTHNQLVAIPNAKHVKLGNLTYLNLQRNKIGDTISIETFLGYFRLRSLNLHENGIRRISHKAFRYVPTLETIRLSKNDIARLQKDIFLYLDNLENLNLAENNINDLDVSIFTQTPSLKYLDMSDNKHLLAHTKENFTQLLKPLKKLTKINLSGAKIKDMPNSLFYGLTELSIVGLSDISLTIWSPDLFRDQSKIKILSMARNKMSTIQQANIEYLTSLQQLDVSGNVFLCDCDLQWFTDWIKSGTFTYLVNLDSMTCDLPIQKRKDNLLNLNLDWECMSMTVYKVYWTMIFCYMLTVTLSTTLYRFRWYLK